VVIAVPDRAAAAAALAAAPASPDGRRLDMQPIGCL
jgi:hypothetical protein